MLEKFIDYFVKRHLLTNLVFITVLGGGVLSWQHIKKEEMPDITFDRVHISASYPGATAEEVEHFVTNPIEDEIQGLDGIYRITSTASQGSTSVSVEIEKDYPNKDEVITEIRNAVLEVDLPADIRDDPKVRVFKTSKKAIIDIMLFHTGRHLLDTATRRTLQEYAHALEKQLLNLPHVNSVDKSGYLQEEIQIKVDPKKLISYRIPLSQVMTEVKNNHVRQPAGHIEAKNEPKVTLSAELDTIDVLNELAVQAGFEGRAVPLKDVAAVTREYDRGKDIFKVNGHEAVRFSVVKNSTYGILESIAAVNKSIERFKKQYLQNVPIELIMLDDESVDVRNRLSIIAFNGSIGFVLILVILFIFLSKRSGFWVAMGIPFTIFFTLIAAQFLGYTINNITLAAVIIVMGMVVDDAIVVAENIGRLRAEGMGSREAAVKGTAYVFMPILASIITTCIAFVPLLTFSGRFGLMMKYIPGVIFLMLGASLFEALIILPGHMHFELPVLNGNKKKGDAKLKAISKHWFLKVEARYARFLERLLPAKGYILMGFVALLVLSGVIMTQTMRFVMFPHEETREISLGGYAPEDADRFDTAEMTSHIEKIIHPYIGKEVVGIRTSIARSRRGGAVEENRFRMVVEIVSREKRKRSADQLIALWKKDIEKIEGLRELQMHKSRWGQSSGSAIEILVQENDDALRKRAADKLASMLEEHPALANIDIERPIDIPEYKIDLKREKIKRLAISPSDMATAFRTALEGSILYELPKGDEEVDVRLTVNDESKEDIQSILEIPVENRQDYLVPLGDLVEVKKTVTPNSISRRDRNRTTMVYADLKPRSGLTPLEIADDIEEEIFTAVIADQPTTTLDFAGEIQDTRESQGDLRNGVFLALFLIFAVLAVLFNSLTRPLIIMLAIPFGVVGVVLAFIAHMKFVYGFFAAVGVLGLAGVVINDSIILLTKLDREFRLDQCKNHADIHRKIASISSTRLRAVVLTTLTTVAGVFPTAYGWAGYDDMLSEMMLALSWGLCFGTLITLVLVPCIYSLMQDMRFKMKQKMRLGPAAGVLLAIMASTVVLWPGRAWAADAPASKVLTVEEFIRSAAQNDPYFEQILIDHLKLKYHKDSNLPARDIIASVKGQYDFLLSQDREDPEVTFGLDKLFPFTGTDVSVAYKNTPSLSADKSSSELTFLISQPIAENAFGRGTRVKDEILGAEMDVIRYQVVEAYEDYLASLIDIYCDWYAAYENVLIGRASYDQNKKLLDNILERQRQKIALPIDVNKVRLLVINKDEDLIALEEDFNRLTNLIRKSVGAKGDRDFVPVDPSNHRPIDVDFEGDYRTFTESSRTYAILDLLENKSSLQVEEYADDLLPSTNFLLGYKVSGEEWPIRDENNMAYAGISIEWPFSDQVDRAEYETGRIDLRQQRVSNRNKYLQLYADLRNLDLAIGREQELIRLADDKIRLAEEVLTDEAENYSLGKVTLNDYIDAVNRLDTNKFNRITHLVRLKKLRTEWLRMTDRLVSEKVLAAYGDDDPNSYK